MIAAGVVASGQEASYVIRGHTVPESRAVNGHVQQVVQGGDGEVLVQVSTSLAPIGADGTFASIAAAGPAAAVPAGFEISSELRARLSPDLDAWEAATRIVEFVIERVHYAPDDHGPQDAMSVLSRRIGRCSGIANASAALLQAAGYEARTVSGLLMTDTGPVPHRWLECRLPGVGWVACDPTLGLWVVTPAHIAFPSAVTELPEVRTIALGDGELAALPRRGGLAVRPNLGSELVCRLRAGVGRAEARLAGPAGDVRRVVLEPDGRVSGLLAGVWLLEVEVHGVIVDRAELHLEEGGVHTILVGPEVVASVATAAAGVSD